MVVYANVTEEMQRAAARKIDKAVGRVLDGDNVCGEHPKAKRINFAGWDSENAPAEEFEADKGKKIKTGKGYVNHLTENCCQGRYTPTIDSGRIARNV